MPMSRVMKTYLQADLKDFNKAGFTKTEKEFLYKAIAAGWEVISKGWPDFLITKGNRIAAVEVKRGPDQLMPHQRKVLKLLSKHGIKSYKWSPKRGFIRIKHN